MIVEYDAMYVEAEDENVHGEGGDKKGVRHQQLYMGMAVSRVPTARRIARHVPAKSPTAPSGRHLRGTARNSEEPIRYY
jgi:hypothetical protein